MRMTLFVAALIVLSLLAACSGEKVQAPASAPAPPAKPAQPDAPLTVAVATYVAPDGAKLTAKFDIANAKVELTLPDGRTVVLPQALSGSGARYSNDKETFWEHQDVGTFMVGEKVTFEGRKE